MSESNAPRPRRDAIRQPRPRAPILAAPGPVLNGVPVAIGIDPEARYPDARSYRLKIGLLVPATNISMEHDLWTLLARNQAVAGFGGIGLHATPVVTPVPRFGNADELAAYRDQFLTALADALPIAQLAEPDHLILGMSLEHILHGLAPVRASAAKAREGSVVGMTTWDEAADAALRLIGARRIALLTPFDATGNDNAARMFADLGYDVVSTFGFSCSLARHVAHVPDWAKEKAIIEYLAPPSARIDAVVQCGTNMSLLGVNERLEQIARVPIIAVNTALLWHALRTCGIREPMSDGGALRRSHAADP